MPLARYSRLSTIFAVLVLYWLVPMPIMAYFLDLDSPRPAGMGEAFVSVADDANALFYNPAGLASLREIELAAMYADLFTNVNAGLYTGTPTGFGHHAIAGAAPLAGIRSAAGASWLRFSSAWYQENVWTAAFASRLLSRETTPWGVSLDAGLSGKLLSWNLAAGDYADAEHKSGFTLSAGLLATWREWRLGLSGDNLLPVSMNLDGEEAVPAVWRAGLAYRLSWPAATTLALEFTERDRVRRIKAGAESWINDAVAIRLGGHYEALAFGASVDFRRLAGTPLSSRLDYAFSLPLLVRNSLGTHRMGLDFRWDSAYQQEMHQAAEDKARAARAAEAERQEHALAHLQAAGKLAQTAAAAAETCESLGRNLAALPNRPVNPELNGFARQSQTDLAAAAADLAQATAEIHKASAAAALEAKGWPISEEIKKNLDDESRQISRQAERAAAVLSRLAAWRAKPSVPAPAQSATPSTLYLPLETARREIHVRMAELSQAMESAQSKLDEVREKSGGLPAILDQGAAEALSRGLEKEFEPCQRAAATCRRVLQDLEARAEPGMAAWRSLYRDLAGQESASREASNYAANRREAVMIGYLHDQLSDLGMANKTLAWAEALARQVEEHAQVRISLQSYAEAGTLRRDLRLGDLDLVLVSWKTANRLSKEGAATSILTVKSKGKISQPQGLFVRADSGIRQWSDLKNRALGYISDDVLIRLETGFSADVPGYSQTAFFKLKKRLSSCFAAIVALQLNDIDVIAGPSYLQSIFNRNKKSFTHGMTMLPYPRLGSTPHPVMMAKNLLLQSKWEKIQRLAAYLERLHEIPGGQAVLEAVDAAQLVPWKPDFERPEGTHP